MGLFDKFSHGSRRIMQLLIVNLACWFGWFFEIALAQADLFAKAFESLEFPLEAVTCLVNVLIFSTSLMRGRLDLENGAREVLATLTDPKLKNINGIDGNGLTTCTEEATGIASVEGGGLQTVTTEEQVTETVSTEEATRETASREEKGLKAASVVMLANGAPNSSVKQFMKSNAHVHGTVP
jgi:hypothetical protein